MVTYALGEALVFWPYYILVTAYCGLIFWISGQPDPPVTADLFPHFDKLQHIVAFGLLAGLVLTGMKHSGKSYTLRVLFWVPVVFTVAFGLSDEFHQGFIPKRSVDPLDIIADTTGAALATWLLLRHWHGHSKAALRGAVRFNADGY
jgi:VanZ family protein